jgi:prepilin-type N-terminal cleavage/methylation domain-containing protein
MKTIHHIKQHAGGFTLVEMLIVMLIAGVLLLTVGLTLFGSQQRASLESVASQMVSDIKAQQSLAMAGVTSQNGSLVDYSIRFDAHAYTWFPGLVYDANNAENTVIPLDAIISLSSITFPSSVLSFSRLSGDVVNFTNGNNSFKIVNTQTGDTYTITVNKRGAIVLTK